MKLKVKHTGKTIDVLSIDYREGDTTISVRYHTEDGYPDYYDFESLKEMNDTLEDYEPIEPLIKDEEIRKAVIAWAKANGQQTMVAYKQLEETISCLSFIDFGGLVIEFNKAIDGLTSGKIYKFTELCGEE